MKKNIVYFLGAGSSYCFGYPLTWKIMPDILKLLKAGKLFNSLPGLVRQQQDEVCEKKLLAYIELVYPGLVDIDLEKEAARVPGITEIFSFVDHLCFYNTPHHPKMSEARLTDFRILLNRALAELLQQYECSITDQAKTALKEKFVDSIKRQYHEYNVTIITTNYDLVIDSAFVMEANQNKVDYGMPYRDVSTNEVLQPPAAGEQLLKYYKLHGSLNWLSCNLCGHYYINPVGSIVFQEFRSDTDSDNTCICNNEMRLKSVLVAPSIVRDIRDSNLLQVWKGALEAIRTADKLVMIGYSLPAEDLAIKSIILRGLNGCTDSVRPEVHVVQYGEKEKPNYLNVFGSDIRHYETEGLEAYLKKTNPELFAISS